MASVFVESRLTCRAGTQKVFLCQKAFFVKLSREWAIAVYTSAHLIISTIRICPNFSGKNKDIELVYTQHSDLTKAHLSTDRTGSNYTLCQVQCLS